MLKVMLCDDDIKDLKNLKRLVEWYWREHNLPEPEIHMTQSSADLLRQVEAGAYFDLYILDVMMEEADGISAGRIIRETGRGRDSIFLYASSSPDFALGAFGVYANGYFLKPVQEREFAECMDFILSRRRPKRESSISVKCTDGIVSVDPDKLMNVENVSRVMHFRLEGGEVVESLYIRHPFEEELKDLLQDYRFIQPHKSFVINMQYVEKMLPHDFAMMDGTVVPISRNNLTVTKKRYLEYLSKEQ